MNSLEPTSYRHILWAPPRNLPFGLRSGCSVYHTQRWRDTGYTGYQGGALLSYHHGIDLFAKKFGDDRSVYAVTWGIVDEIKTSSGESSVLIRHEPFSSGYFTRYRHLRSVEVSNGNEVRAGQRIGYDDGSHVHLEWFQLPNPSETFYGTESGHTFYNVIDLDPTPILYHFDANRWSYEKGGEIERHQHDKYQNITWIRIVAWGGKTSIPATWLFEVLMPDLDDPQNSSEKFYLPVHNGLPHEELLISVIRDAFQQQARVKLKWRESFFYGKRNMIEEVRIKP